jgi:glycolate oxidase FAD binding subunit
LAEGGHPALLLTLASISTTAVAEQLRQLRGAADTYQVDVKQLEGEDLTLAESRGWGATNHGPAGPDTWLVHLGVLPANAKHLLKAVAKLNLHCTLAAGQGQGFAWRWERGLQADQVGLLRERCRALGGDLTVLIQPTVTNLPLSSWSASSGQRWIQAIKREFDPLQQLARGRLPGR